MTFLCDISASQTHFLQLVKFWYFLYKFHKLIFWKRNCSQIHAVGLECDNMHPYSNSMFV